MPFNSDEYVASGLFWFTLSLINAGLAQSKNRSGLNWWLVSLLLGPVATFLIVIGGPGTGSRSSGVELSGRSIAVAALVAVVLLVGGLVLFWRAP